MLKVLLAALAVLYPVLIYFGLAHLRPGVFGVLLAGLVILRLKGVGENERKHMLVPVIVILGYALAVAIADSEMLLRFYPVLVNAMMLIVFGHTLIYGPPLIERIVRARGLPVSPEGQVYVRRVTQVWCAFFVVNGTLAAYTALHASWAAWTLYNGFIAYLAIGALAGGELIFRRFYRRRVAQRRQADG